MIELGKQAELEDKSKEVEAEVIDVVETTDTTGSVMMKEVEDVNV
jgi:ribosomal protein S28E/S33